MIKKIYNIIPLKKQLFTLLKAFYTPTERVYKHLAFKGIFKVKIDSNHQFKIKHYGNLIENEMFWGGVNDGFERVSLGLWIKLCKNASTIFDIGANTGLYSLIAKCMNKESKVYAFEPVERVLEKLKYNNEINNYDIKYYPLALSNKNGKAVIYDTKAEHIYSVTVNKNLFEPDTAVVETSIETATIDHIIETEKIDKIDLLKIDVETHEPEVIEGYLKNIKQHRPTILIEVLTDEVGKKIQSLINGVEYHYFNISEDLGIRKVDSIIKSDSYNYLLCTADVAKNLGLL